MRKLSLFRTIDSDYFIKKTVSKYDTVFIGYTEFILSIYKQFRLH